MLDDIQDSDEDMEDYEESEEDEGSLYAPSETTSELSIEEVSRDADLIELPRVDPCKFLLLLPRELRDKVGVLSAATFVRAYALMICLRR